MGRLDLVQNLVQKEGTDVNLIDSMGQSPLFDAAQHGHLHVVQFLIQRGADMNMKRQYGGHSNLPSSVQRPRGGGSISDPTGGGI